MITIGTEILQVNLGRTSAEIFGQTLELIIEQEKCSKVLKEISPNTWSSKEQRQKESSREIQGNFCKKKSGKMFAMCQARVTLRTSGVCNLKGISKRNICINSRMNTLRNFRINLWTVHRNNLWSNIRF